MKLTRKISSAGEWLPGWTRKFSPRFLPSLLSLAYPPVCEECGQAYFDGTVPGVCPPCCDEHLYPMDDNCCSICGQRYPGEVPTTYRCGNCGGRELAFDFSVGAYRAEGPVMDWIHRYKYRGEIHFARTFGKLMTRVWEDERLSGVTGWTVVPVPLHRKRFRERGFNQSLEIAREWIRHSPCRPNLRLVNALKRIRHTSRQATLDRKDRLTNLRDAFALSSAGIRHCRKDQNFIIVDDVLTTGATASECARVLREHFDPCRITIATVIRG